MYNSTIIFGSLTLQVDKLTATKVPGTRKQVVGKSLQFKEIPASAVQDWRITIEGRQVLSTRDTERTTLQGYDDLVVHTLTDGVHDGNYFVVSLEYMDDVYAKPASHNYRLILIQDQ